MKCIDAIANQNQRVQITLHKKNSLYIFSPLFLPFFSDTDLCIYKMKRFSQLLVFLLIPSRCLRILRRCLLRLLRVAWSLSRWGFSLTWARIPTSNSSTWWASPDEVSMNLQPQLLARRRPTAGRERDKYKFKKAFSNRVQRVCRSLK